MSRRSRLDLEQQMAEVQQRLARSTKRMSDGTLGGRSQSAAHPPPVRARAAPVAVVGSNVIVHGSDAARGRPGGHQIVFWIGTTAPTNPKVNDVWIDTT